ncbi:hypothetical protein EW145_g6567 [Phellinidium pouzarii]|uniref:Brain protein I3 n=1 Tax=Phellinidium pouzarii TaxID=167371 RepID=A0A4S4KWB0_9AGAM|nr:hypothetical protein EW145_g6567 [Phellinidium pouzarii]
MHTQHNGGINQDLVSELEQNFTVQPVLTSSFSSDSLEDITPEDISMAELDEAFDSVAAALTDFCEGVDTMTGLVVKDRFDSTVDAAAVFNLSELDKILQGDTPIFVAEDYQVHHWMDGSAEIWDVDSLKAQAGAMPLVLRTFPVSDCDIRLSQNIRNLMTNHATLVGENSAGAGAKGDEPSYNPPSYDYATGRDRPSTMAHKSPALEGSDKQGPAPPQPMPMPMPMPNSTYTPVPPPGPSGSARGRGGGGMVYQYQHPVTGQVLSSVLPPDHPEMICLQEGTHVRATRYGILGILAAVFWFPLGIGLCLLDRRVVCARCGHVINGGISC